MFAARILVVMALMCASIAFGQDASTYAIERQQALDLYKANKMDQALPLLDKLAAENPADIGVQEALGMAAWERNSTDPDPQKRKQWCEKARAALLKAKNLGDDSNLLQNVLPSIPENCEVENFSDKKNVDDIMRAAEGAFSRGDFDAALRGYQQALVLDPNLYPAALFSGDVYFKRGDQDKAGQSYARAIQIDPNIETAYRYWGDALTVQGNLADAREKYIDAIVAQPYIRRSWTGIMQWAQRAKVQLKGIQIQTHGSFDVKDNGNANITIDPSTLGDNGGAAWMIYPITRVDWRNKTFAEKFPGQKYRHTLQEETEALENVATSAEQMLKDQKIKQVDPQLSTLIELKQKGLIEAYVLLSAPDQDIAQDYEAYRQKNRGKLHLYLSTYIVPPAP